ncbi:MAG: hypothetical protein ACYS0E_02135 [Planctomycetota bacterium]|jgi:hypothetical protein
MKSLVLCLALLTGCASWNVDAFGYHMQASDKYQTSSDSKSMSTEEKWGVVLVLGVAIGAGIAVAAAAN